MGRLNLETPGAREKIASWRKEPGMLGLRFSFQRPWLTPMLKERRIDWMWQEAEKAGVPVMTLALHSDMHLIDRVAERHPRLKLTIDHLGLTTGKGAEAFQHIDNVLALAKRPNVAVKVSCLPHYATDAYPFRSLQPYIRRVYDAFGPKRMFWGSDLSRLPCSYRQGLTYLSEEIPWLPAGDKEWILGRGLCEWLGWKR